MKACDTQDQKFFTKCCSFKLVLCGIKTLQCCDKNILVMINNHQMMLYREAITTLWTQIVVHNEQKPPVSLQQTHGE